MTTPLRVGDVLHGYCGGWFSDPTHGDKRVEAIGSDWVVVRGEATWSDDLIPMFAKCDPEDLCQYRAETLTNDKIEDWQEDGYPEEM